MSAWHVLVDVSGLQNLSLVNGDLEISSNRQLATVDAWELANAIDRVVGDTVISGNGR